MTGALVVAVVKRELDLQQRDERVEQTLRDAIDEAREYAAQLREEARIHDAKARRIKQAAMSERWWQLADLLSASDIDSLCNVSPKGLLG